MVFNRYGDKYFLAEAWSGPGHEWAVSVSQSKTEREIARTSPDVARGNHPLRTGAVALARFGSCDGPDARGRPGHAVCGRPKAQTDDDAPVEARRAKTSQSTTRTQEVHHENGVSRR